VNLRKTGAATFNDKPSDRLLEQTWQTRPGPH